MPYYVLNIIGLAAPITMPGSGISTRDVVNDINDLLGLITPALSQSGSASNSVQAPSQNTIKSTSQAQRISRENIIPLVGIQDDEGFTHVFPVSSGSLVPFGSSQLAGGNVQQTSGSRSFPLTSNIQTSNSNNNVGASQRGGSIGAEQPSNQASVSTTSNLQSSLCSTSSSGGIAILPIKAGDVMGIAIIPMTSNAVNQGPANNPLIAESNKVPDIANGQQSTNSTLPVTGTKVTPEGDTATPIQASTPVAVTTPSPNKFSNAQGQHTINKTPLGAGYQAPGEAEAKDLAAINPVPIASTSGTTPARRIESVLNLSSLANTSSSSPAANQPVPGR